MTAEETKERFDVIVANPPFDPQAAQRSLESGNLLHLLAEVEAGKITADQLGNVLDLHRHKRWFRDAILTVIGRTS